MTLDSEDGLIRVTYQPIYNTIWEYEDGYIQDNPDIAIKVKNGVTIILDAKNSHYSKTLNPHPNRAQMDSYIRYTDA
jgi:hypothetical protein